MIERTCENCRWHLRRTSTGVAGECRRHPPTRGRLGWSFALTDSTYFCGEWADKNITPEQEKRRELVRRFAVAIANSSSENIWKTATAMADAEPGQI